VQHAHVIFGALGLGFSDFAPVYLDFAAGAEALAAGEIDAQFQCPIPNKVMSELAERVALRVISYAPGQLETVLQAVPYYRRAVIGKGEIRGLEANTPQIAVINVLVTHPRVPEKTVREAVAAIVASCSELGRLNLLFAEIEQLFAPLRLQGAAALEFGGVPLHPGARRAYRDLGLLV
jgi:TRAP transporter TAXI family solute receptor